MKNISQHITFYVYLDVINRIKTTTFIKNKGHWTYQLPYESKKKKVDFAPEKVCHVYVIAWIVILSVVDFFSFSVLAIGNNLIKLNYLITFYYYWLITKCN